MQDSKLGKLRILETWVMYLVVGKGVIPSFPLRNTLFWHQEKVRVTSASPRKGTTGRLGEAAFRDGLFAVCCESFVHRWYESCASRGFYANWGWGCKRAVFRPVATLRVRQASRLNTVLFYQKYVVRPIYFFNCWNMYIHHTQWFGFRRNSKTKGFRAIRLTEHLVLSWLPRGLAKEEKEYYFRRNRLPVFLRVVGAGRKER
jgi:hypothetical protein